MVQKCHRFKPLCTHTHSCIPHTHTMHTHRTHTTTHTYTTHTHTTHHAHTPHTHTHHTENRGGIIWYRFTPTKSTITGIGGKEACVSSMSTEGSAAMLFAMTLPQKLVSSLDADEECAEILLQAWYLDNGALAGTRSAVLHALHLIEELGPALGLHVNLAKCEMFSRRGNTSFPLEVRCSLLPNLYIIGAPIGYFIAGEQ